MASQVGHNIMRAIARLSACAMTGLCVGCGGGVALMHPAHTLAPSQVTMGAGVSGNFVLGDANEAIDDAAATRGQAGVAVTDESQATFLAGGIAQTLMTPGVAPWVGARAGIGHDSEAGITYTGRYARLDARHAFEGESVALSAGLGASGRLMQTGSYRPQADDPTCNESEPGCGTSVHGRVDATGEIPDLDEGSVTGWGVDVPVIVGWRSTARVVQAYGGVRVGHERVWGDYAWQVSPDEVSEAEMRGYRTFAGGLIGLLVSIDPLWAGIEIASAYHWGSGELDIQTGRDTENLSAEVRGWSLTPTAAIGARF
jgi:hypothetical protein